MENRLLHNERQPLVGEGVGYAQAKGCGVASRLFHRGNGERERVHFVPARYRGVLVVVVGQVAGA